LTASPHAWLVGVEMTGIQTQARLQPTAVRYIKLGPGGAWAHRCLSEGWVELDHAAVPHGVAAAGDWGRVRALFLERGSDPGKATGYTRELRDFYTLPETALWITIANGRLWWTFAAVEVVEGQGRGTAARARRSIGGWRDKSVLGEPLLLNELSTRLTSVAAYQQTICGVREADYLVRRLNGEPEPAVGRALAAQAELTAAAGDLIQGLHWRDFELLVDLIFAGSGWRRVSAVGGSDQADSDLVLEQAVTGERAMVQVKSSADQAVIDDYAGRFRAGGWDRCFLVCHSPKGQLRAPADPAFHLWQGEALSRQATDAGLLPWLIAKTR
jgi:hypothetical protein